MCYMSYNSTIRTLTFYHSIETLSKFARCHALTHTSLHQIPDLSEANQNIHTNRPQVPAQEQLALIKHPGPRESDIIQEVFPARLCGNDQGVLRGLTHGATERESSPNEPSVGLFTSADTAVSIA